MNVSSTAKENSRGSIRVDRMQRILRQLRTLQNQLSKNSQEYSLTNALVTFFPASGMTATLAKRLAEANDAPVYENKSTIAYTQADLDWTNKKARSTVEMQDKSCRPALADTTAPVANVVFVGYPVWWYREPSIIDSFLATYDFSGKTIVLFATSGNNDIGKEEPARAAEIINAEVKPGKRFSSNASINELKVWAEQYLN